MAIKIKGSTVIDDQKEYNIDLIPSSTAIDLGSSAKEWRHLYISGNIVINETTVINSTQQWAAGNFKPNSTDYSIGETGDRWKDMYLSGKAEITGWIATDKLYLGNATTNGYFHSDEAGRTAFSGGKFYIKSGVSHYYNYAPLQYHGNSDGSSAHYFRGNVDNAGWTVSGTSWSITGEGALDVTSVNAPTVSATTVTATTVNGAYVNATGDSTFSSNLLVGALDSSASRRLEISADTGQWAYTRFKTDDFMWDVGAKSNDYDGALQFRPNGSSTGRMTLSKAGNLSINGEVTSNSGKFGEGLYSDNNDVILDLDTERPWRFIQDGSGPSTSLTLEGYYSSDNPGDGGGNKVFTISAPGATPSNNSGGGSFQTVTGSVRHYSEDGSTLHHWDRGSDETPSYSGGWSSQDEMRNNSVSSCPANTFVHWMKIVNCSTTGQGAGHCIQVKCAPIKAIAD